MVEETLALRKAALRQKVKALTNEDRLEVFLSIADRSPIAYSQLMDQSHLSLHRLGIHLAWLLRDSLIDKTRSAGGDPARGEVFEVSKHGRELLEEVPSKGR